MAKDRSGPSAAVTTASGPAAVPLPPRSGSSPSEPSEPSRPSRSELPERWPSAWPSLRFRLFRRAAFVAVVQVLTAVGLAVVADLATQWWALLPPLLLLAGPATAPARARRRAQRATGTGRLTVDPDGLAWPTPAGRGPLARVEPDGTVRYLR
jgi:hypothetical protein